MVASVKNWVLHITHFIFHKKIMFFRQYYMHNKIVKSNKISMNKNFDLPDIKDKLLKKKYNIIGGFSTSRERQKEEKTFNHRYITKPRKRKK